jgi:hypothetical protein
MNSNDRRGWAFAFLGAGVNLIVSGAVSLGSGSIRIDLSLVALGVLSLGVGAWFMRR